MTRDDIIRMAREAGFVDSSFCRWSAYSDDLERFFHKAYAAGAAAEREACLEVLQDFGAWGHDPNETSKAIRARGEQK